MHGQQNVKIYYGVWTSYVMDLEEMLFLCLELQLLILTPEDKILYHNLFLRKHNYYLIETVPSSPCIKYTTKRFKSKMLSPTGESWRQKEFAFEALCNKFYIQWQREKFKYILVIFCMLHHCQRSHGPFICYELNHPVLHIAF